MAGACPAIDPDGPLVRTLMSDADCHVQALVQSGYGVLFATGGAFSGVLTLLMTLFVALIGYAMLLGRAPLSVSGVVLSAVKLGVVLALTTQWATYQTVVYDFLFHGPEAIGSALLKGLSDTGAGPQAGVFDQLQRAYADLTGFSANIIPPGGLSSAPALQVNPPTALGGGLATNTDASTLMLAATILIVSTVGVLIAAKVVLGLLLAVGPLFIALFLFDGTRGLFEGWLRATIGFALTPLFVGVLTALGVALLSPWLDRLEAMQASGSYVRGAAFSILVLTLVLAAVTAGVIVAAAIVGAGLRLPRLRSPQTDRAGARETASSSTSSRSRVQVIAEAARTLESRDTVRSRSLSIASAASSRTMTRSFAIASGVTMATAPGVARRSAGPRPARLRKVE